MGNSTSSPQPTAQTISVAKDSTSPSSKKKASPSTRSASQTIYFGLLAIVLALSFFHINSSKRLQTLPKMASVSSTTRLISRGVAKRVKSIETPEGAGAVVRRSIGTPALRNISPFLMLDHFRIGEGAGFPDHPHRGQTTVTYILDGLSQHEDFAGHAGTIGPGDVQWMNAGRGIMHAEMPIHRDAQGNKLADPVGLQLWVDLPAHAKKEPPSYQEYRADKIPTATPRAKEPVETEGKGWTVKVVAGESHGIVSPIELPKNGGVLYLDITLDPSGSIRQPISSNYNAFIYTLEGQIRVGDDDPSAGPGETYDQYHTLVLDTQGQGVTITNPSTTSKARMILVAGEPLDQGVVQYGPFVMTSRQEIQQTLLDFQGGMNGFERAPGWRSEIGATMR